MGLGWSQQWRSRSGAVHDPSRVLPPEIFVHVLTYLRLEDLPNAACVSKSWNAAIMSNYLWMQLSILMCPPLRVWVKNRNIKWRTIFRQLQACVYVFNENIQLGVESIVCDFYVPPGPENTIRFLCSTKGVSRMNVARYILPSQDMTKMFVHQLSLKNVQLPDALRAVFDYISLPPASGVNFVTPLINLFAERYVECNSHLPFTRESVFLLCFALLLLSADLTTPHVRNKMSKREFVRVNRAHLFGHDDYLGRLYDNVYLFGHIGNGHRAAGQASQRIFSNVLRTS